MLTVSMYWIAGALFVDIAKFWWLVPFAVAGLPAILAIYYGMAAALAWRWGLGRLDGALMLASLWFMADYARGHLFTGFPWDVTGYAWGEVLPVLQLTSVIGIYGLTLVTLLLALLPAARNGKLVLASLVLLAGCATWGQWRITHASTEMVPNVRLRLVQTDVEQSDKWRRATAEANFDRLLDLSYAPAVKTVTHVVWPETAAAFYLTEDDESRRLIAERMPNDMTVLTGVVRRELMPSGEYNYYNSLIAIDSQSRVTASYDKVHLVPFGEYIPFRSLLPVAATIAGTGQDFSAGKKHVTLRVSGLPPFSPLICYEAIFSGEVTADNDRPAFLLNVTNDGWYDHTIGPYQHFAIARVRAVEEGLPLVRVANKGVVAVVDAYGRVVAKLGWDKPDFIDSDLPKAPPKPTLYAGFRDAPLWGMLAGIGLLTWLLRIRNLQLGREHITLG